jgi:hypothetical protein
MVKCVHKSPIDSLDVSAVQRVIVTLSRTDNSITFCSLVDANMADLITTPFRKDVSEENILYRSGRMFNGVV